MRRTGGLGSGASDPLLSQRGNFFIYFHYIFIVIFIFLALVTFGLWSTPRSKGLFVQIFSSCLHLYLYLLISCNLLLLIYSSVKAAVCSDIFIFICSHCKLCWCICSALLLRPKRMGEWILENICFTFCLSDWQNLESVMLQPSCVVCICNHCSVKRAKVASNRRGKVNVKKLCHNSKIGVDQAF